MDEPVVPLASLAANEPLPAPIGTEPVPTLMDLAVDASWGTTAPESAPNDVEPETPQPVWQRVVPAWIRDRRNRADLENSVTELDTAATEPVDRGPEPLWQTALKTVGAFVASSAIAYLVLTFPSQVAKASYFVDHLGKGNTPSKIVSGTTTTGNFSQVVTPSLSFTAPTIASPTPSANQSSPFASLTDNQLYVPKLDVKAPIVWDSSFDEKAMLANLQKGVVHYGGTDFPSSTHGNVFITGHSSYYWWDSGKYKTVFANLDQMNVGDQAALTYLGNVYVYQVFDKSVVKPTQTDVLNSTEKPILTLMTCTPVGTSLNRLIVKANLVGVFTEGAANAQPTQTPSNSSTPIPATAPNDTNQLLPGLR